MTKYTKFTKDAYNFDTEYPLLGIFLKKVIGEVCKHLASRMFILTLFVMTKKGGNISIQ